MAGLPITVDLDFSELFEAVEAAGGAPERVAAMLAEAIATEFLPAEAPKGATGQLSEPWEANLEGDLSWRVFPTADAFYAHMVARGTRGHGPASARAMTVEGRFVTFVSGRAADPFHLRATQTAEDRAGELLAEALAEEGL